MKEEQLGPRPAGMDRTGRYDLIKRGGRDGALRGRMARGSGVKEMGWDGQRAIHALYEPPPEQTGA